MAGKKWVGWVVAIAALGIGVQANATNLLINGDFELTTLPGSNQFGSGYPTNQLTGWYTDGYNFVFAPGTADTTGSDGAFGNLKLWGPGNGAANGLTATSPVGGNYIAADGGLFGYTKPFSQDLTGLEVGGSYKLSFWWASAQQYGFDGDTTENWTATFGSESFTTPTVANVSHGFTPWEKVTYTFTATSAAQTLSFLANGTPEGQPPFSLIDGARLDHVGPGVVPEPKTWAMMIVGFGFVGAMMRGRRKATSTNPESHACVGIA